MSPSTSYSHPSDDLGYISAERRIYSEQNLSKSFPSHLSTNSTYSVHGESPDSSFSARISPDMVTDGPTSLSVQPQSTVRESSKRMERGQQVGYEESELELNNIGYPGVVGIKNHGNTCYASSVIQCLSNTEYFTEHFVNDRHRARLVAAKQSGRRCGVTDGLAQLIESLWTRTYTSKLSRDLLKAVMQNTELFTDSNGHDAEEFLLWLLNTVNDELYGPPKQDKVQQVACIFVLVICNNNNRNNNTKIYNAHSQALSMNRRHD